METQRTEHNDIQKLPGTHLSQLLRIVSCISPVSPYRCWGNTSKQAMGTSLRMYMHSYLHECLPNSLKYNQKRITD
jgi:hypothetical protein